jgi:hypothetical protein
MEQAIVAFQPSTSLELNNSLSALEAQLYQAAEANVNAVASEGYTQAERHAMIVVEQLKLVNSMDLAAVHVRGKLLDQIEAEGLWAFHPGQYGTLEQMARDQGISVSELSNIRNLTRVIFPYMEQTLGIPVAQVWEQIGKSNFREMTAVLTAIISGEEPGNRTTAESVALILDETAATAHAAGQEVTPESVRRAAVENLLNDASSMSTRQVRRRLRPDPTPTLEPAVIRSNGRRVIVMEADDEQYTLFQRVMDRHIDVREVDLPSDPGARQREALRVQQVQRLISMLEG